jgi:hypothetical protein
MATAPRKIVAEVWDRHQISVPHSTPLSRHRTVEVAVAVARRANQRPGIEGDPYIVLFYENGAFIPLRSWKPTVQVYREPGWHYNSVRFASPAHALASAKDLFHRWMSVETYTIHPSGDEPNYVRTDSGDVPLFRPADALPPEVQ